MLDCCSNLVTSADRTQTDCVLEKEAKMSLSTGPTSGGVGGMLGGLGGCAGGMFHRMCSTVLAVNKAQQLLQGLQATGDEGQQLTACIEMCQVRRFTFVPNRTVGLSTGAWDHTVPFVKKNSDESKTGRASARVRGEKVYLPADLYFT